MVEQRKSWSILVGMTDLITAASGTKQILNYKPAKGSVVVVNVEIVEMFEEKKGD